MATDWPGQECYVHSYGPPPVCAANRFYPNTVCSPPRFWQYSVNEVQTESYWDFINNLEWLEPRPPYQQGPNWENNAWTTDPANITLDLIDNTITVPPYDQFAFVAVIKVENNILADPIPFLVQYRARYYFGPDHDRSMPIPLINPVWTKTSGTPPITNPPLGDWVFLPRMCQPGWEPGQFPK